MAIAALAGFVAVALGGVAFASALTLQVARKAKVVNQTGTARSESIVVNSRGFAVYSLTGDSRAHPKCTRASGCFAFWPPLKAASPKHLSKAAGIHGRLGVWHRNGFFQVTLAGRPLYRYAGDMQRRVATGDGVTSFGGTWHVERAAGGSPKTSATTTTNTATTTTTTTCLYPPCY